MLDFLKRTPKLEATFHPTHAVARELAREVEIAGELVLRNRGRATELDALEVVLVAGGTRRIDLALPPGWAGRQRLETNSELRAAVAWRLVLAAPMRAPAAEIQVNTTAGGKRRPLAMTAPFPLTSE